MELTLERAKELIAQEITEEHLFRHSTNVMAAMGAMAEHFGEDKEHWMAVGYLHDFDYEKYPDEHLAHTAEPLREKGVPEEDIRATEELDQALKMVGLTLADHIIIGGHSYVSLREKGIIHGVI